MAAWARRNGIVLFIDTDNRLKMYPKSNPKWRTLELMLAPRHPEMKMYLIRSTLEGE